MEAAYPGGLAAYLVKAKALLASAAAGANPFEGWAPSVPSGEDLVYADDEFAAMEAVGMEAASRLGSAEPYDQNLSSFQSHALLSHSHHSQR